MFIVEVWFRIKFDFGVFVFGYYLFFIFIFSKFFICGFILCIGICVIVGNCFYFVVFEVFIDFVGGYEIFDLFGDLFFDIVFLNWEFFVVVIIDEFLVFFECVVENGNLDIDDVLF